MTKHPLRTAVETGASTEEFGRLFSPKVVLWTPIMTKPITGVGKVLEILGNSERIAGPIRFSCEVSDTKQTFLLWKGQAGGFPLEAAMIVVDDDDGLIREVRVLMRPWPVVTIFRDAMHRALASSIPGDCWELQPKAPT